jgi:hypothetical protein
VIPELHPANAVGSATWEQKTLGLMQRFPLVTGPIQPENEICVICVICG